MLTCGLGAIVLAIVALLLLTSRFRRVGFGSPCIARLANTDESVYRGPYG